ncbi:hypothetical protein [Niallia taxi]|uniref:hypothetical protein n=1 Tax=Niallia taxi TaxID=2499688 RepID=UPI0015F3E9F0|nr:hypothetical protein [Niallia taxi]
MHLLISISLAWSLVGLAGETPLTYEMHSERKSMAQSDYQKSLPAGLSVMMDEPKEIYSLQFSEDAFYQVEKTYIENQYGSTKETQIYYKKDEHYHLLSRHELTDRNILSEQISQYTKQELEKLTIDNQS